MPYEPRTIPPYAPVIKLDSVYQPLSCLGCNLVKMFYVPKDIKKYPYLIIGPCCLDCTYILEHDFMHALTFEQMPMWMGHTWVFNIIKEAYEYKLMCLLQGV